MSIGAYRRTLEEIFQLADQGISLGVDLTSTKVVNWDLAARKVSFILQKEEIQITQNEEETACFYSQKLEKPTTFFKQFDQLTKNIFSIQTVLTGDILCEKKFLLQAATILEITHEETWDTMREGTLEENVSTVIANLSQLILANLSHSYEEYKTSDNEIKAGQRHAEKNRACIDKLQMNLGICFTRTITDVFHTIMHHLSAGELARSRQVCTRIKILIEQNPLLVNSCTLAQERSIAIQNELASPDYPAKAIEELFSIIGNARTVIQMIQENVTNRAKQEAYFIVLCRLIAKQDGKKARKLVDKLFTYTTRAFDEALVGIIDVVVIKDPKTARKMFGDIFDPLLEQTALTLVQLS